MYGVARPGNVLQEVLGAGGAGAAGGQVGVGGREREEKEKAVARKL